MSSRCFQGSCNIYSSIALSLKITLGKDGSMYRNNPIPVPLGAGLPRQLECGWTTSVKAHRSIHHGLGDLVPMTASMAVKLVFLVRSADAWSDPYCIACRDVD